MYPLLLSEATLSELLSEQTQVCPCVCICVFRYLFENDEFTSLSSISLRSTGFILVFSISNCGKEKQEGIFPEWPLKLFLFGNIFANDQIGSFSYLVIITLMSNRLNKVEKVLY